MRLVVALTLPTVTTLALLGCNPPLEENVAPFVEMITPRITFVDGEQRAVGYSGAPVPFALRITDRDGDELFDVTVYLNTTPGEEGGLTEIGSAQDVGADVLVTFETSIPLAAGPQSLEVHVDDRRREGVRIIPLSFDPIAAQPPIICWGSGADCTDTTTSLPDTLTPLRGTFPSADTSTEAYLNFWQLEGGEAGPITGAFPAVLDPLETARGETWRFCVQRWVTGGGPPPTNAEGVRLLPDLTICDSIEIGDTAPGAP